MSEMLEIIFTNSYNAFIARRQDRSLIAHYEGAEVQINTIELDELLENYPPPSEDGFRPYYDGVVTDRIAKLVIGKSAASTVGNILTSIWNRGKERGSEIARDEIKRALRL